PAEGDPAEEELAAVVERGAEHLGEAFGVVGQGLVALGLEPERDAEAVAERLDLRREDPRVGREAGQEDEPGAGRQERHRCVVSGSGILVNWRMGRRGRGLY